MSCLSTNKPSVRTYYMQQFIISSNGGIKTQGRHGFCPQRSHYLERVDSQILHLNAKQNKVNANKKKIQCDIRRQKELLILTAGEGGEFNEAFTEEIASDLSLKSE